MCDGLITFFKMGRFYNYPMSKHVEKIMVEGWEVRVLVVGGG